MDRAAKKNEGNGAQKRGWAFVENPTGHLQAREVQGVWKGHQDAGNREHEGDNHPAGK